MLEFVKVKSSSVTLTILQSYNPLQDTWIVSDLKSKQEIQNEAIRRQSYFTDDAILRVSDFWRLWLRRFDPTLQVVSSDFIQSLVQSFVDRRGQELQLDDSEVFSLNKALQEFAPILLHPESHGVLQEWVEQQTNRPSWWRWYLLASGCLEEIVDEHRALDAKWSAAYLQSLDLEAFKWPRKIYVDLGTEMSSVEMGLFKILAQVQDVVIVTPDPDWKDKFPYLLNTYKENFGYGKMIEVTTGTPEKNQTLKPQQFKRLSTQLAEVKFAVAQLRQWAEQGVSLEKMAVISADIEAYWPALKFYLDAEGIPYAKDSVAQLNSLGDIQSLLAALKNYSHDVAWDSLEKFYFSSASQPKLRYEKFRSLFYQLYDDEDLAREEAIKKIFYKKIDFTTDISRDEFLVFLVKTWLSLQTSAQSENIFEVLCRDVLTQSLNIKMKLQLWIVFLKNRLSHKEISVSRKSENGVQIVSLMSAQFLPLEHRVYIGLNDEFYHRKQTALMSLSDSLTLKNQFDLAIDFSEESYLDFNLRWQIESCGDNVYLTSAHMGFGAEPLNASLFFIENNPKSEIELPALTRADEIQKSLTNEKILEQLSAPVNGFNIINEKKYTSSQVKSDIFSLLSVSDTESYAQCHFKLLAAKGFNLRDLPLVGLDLDPRQKGSLMHLVFEKCIQLLQAKEYSEAALESYLNEVRNQDQLYPAQDPYWKIQLKKFLQMAARFVNFEKQRLEVFKAEVEKQVTLYFDIENKCFVTESAKNLIGFSVRLDRYDIHKQKKYLIIYDYKSSASQASNYGKWIDEKQYQMLLYYLALQSSLGASDEIKATLYYQYKNFDLSKGMVDEAVALEDLGLSRRNKSLIGTEQRQELLNEFTEVLSECLKQIKEEKFQVSPFDRKICDTCDWRKICRAPHLM